MFYLSAIKEASKIIVAVLLSVIVGLLIQLAITSPSEFQEMIKKPEVVLDYIVSSLFAPVQNISLFVILVVIFAFSAALINSLQNLWGAPKVSVEKAPKEKKEKKEKIEAAKTQVKEAAPGAEEPAPAGPTEPCPICGKPKPMGRAICKECEEKLKMGPEAFSKPTTG